MRAAGGIVDEIDDGVFGAARLWSEIDLHDAVGADCHGAANRAKVVPDRATAKLAASGPVNVSCERVRAALPRFRRVIGWGPLVAPIASVPKVSAAGDRLAIGEAATPEPDNAITCLAEARPPESSVRSISA